MTVAASQGVIGWGGQTAKGTLATTWYRHKAVQVETGAQQDVRQFPQEVGGGFHPTGAYKRMGFAAGQVVMHPRLQDVIGWLLYAGVGGLSTISGTPEAGMYRHQITPPSDFCDMKWISVRKEVPAGCDVGSENLGEILKDVRVGGIRFAAEAGGLAQMAATFVGREPKLSETGVDTWTWDNSYEDKEGVPTAAASDQVDVGGTTYAATNIIVDIQNQFTTPDEELIIGSYYPDDMILQQQVMNVRWTYKWEDPELYKAIVSGTEVEAAGEIDWSPTVHTDSFTAAFKSPGNATGMSNPWRIEFYAPEMVWQAAGSPRLVGGGWLSLEFQGIAQEPTSGDTFRVRLDNLTSGYTWPS